METTSQKRPFWLTNTTPKGGRTPKRKKLTALKDKEFTINNTSDFATSFAILMQKHTDLKQIIQAWEGLPDHIKAAIKALIETNRNNSQ